MAEDTRGKSGRTVVIGLTVEFRGVRRDFVAELPFGGNGRSLASALAREVDYAPEFVDIEVVRTREHLAQEAAAADCNLRSGDVIRLHPSRPPAVPVEIALKPRARTREAEPLVTIQSRPGDGSPSPSQADTRETPGRNLSRKSAGSQAP